MGISSTTNRVSYAGDGSSTVFPFSFEFFASADLNVYLYNVASSIVQPQSLSTNYSISGSVNSQGIYPSGGNVVMTSSVPTTHQIIITRNPSPINNYILSQNGPISSIALTQQLDYLTTLVQRHTDQLSRTVLLPDGVGTQAGVTFDPTLPQITPLTSQAANAPLVLNSGATGWTYGTVATSASGATSYYGTLPVVNGGTGQNLPLIPYGVWYSLNGSSMANIAPGGPGTILTSQGSSVPTWQFLNIASSVIGVLGVSSGGTGTGTSYIQYGVLFASSATQIANTVAGGQDVPLVGQAGAAPAFGPLNLTSGSTTSGALSLTSKVSGILPVSNGGTNNSSFTSSAILFASSANTVGGILPGGAGTALISNGSSAPSFQTITVTNNIANVTGNTVTTNANNKIIAASSLYTIFLYKPAGGDSGKEIEILVKDSSFQFITVQGSNCTITGQQAAAVNSTALGWPGEVLKLYNDGSNWFVNNHYFPSGRILMGSTVITVPAGANAIAKASSITVDQWFVQRVGKTLKGYAEYFQTTGGNAGGGTPPYKLQAVPSALKIDCFQVQANSTAGVIALAENAVGTAQGSAAGASQVSAWCSVYDSTNIVINGFFGGAENFWGSTNTIANVNVKMGWEWEVPISGWDII